MFVAGRLANSVLVSLRGSHEGNGIKLENRLHLSRCQCLVWRFLPPSMSNEAIPHALRRYQVVYMDTEGNFRPERIESIAERFGLDAGETLENIIVTRVFNHEQQIERAHVRKNGLKRLPHTIV